MPGFVAATDAELDTLRAGLYEVQRGLFEREYLDHMEGVRRMSAAILRLDDVGSGADAVDRAPGEPVKPLSFGMEIREPGTAH